MVLTFLMKLQSQNPVLQRTLKTTFNLTEVFLKKNKTWSILSFRSKEIKMRCKLAFNIDKQKTCFLHLNYVIKTSFIYVKFIVSSVRLSIAVCTERVPCVCLALGVSLIQWNNGNHNVWTPVFVWKNKIFSESSSLSRNLSLWRYLVSSGCNL